MIERYVIFIKDILSGNEKVHPQIYYSKFDAKLALEDLPYSKIHNEIKIKILL